MTTTIYVIDDENSAFIENLRDALTHRGATVIMLEHIKKARQSLPAALEANAIVIDLMIPLGPGEERDVEDVVEPGARFCLDVVNCGYEGVLAVITNADRERHPRWIGEVESALRHARGGLGVFYKPSCPATTVANRLLAEVSTRGHH